MTGEHVFRLCEGGRSIMSRLSVTTGMIRTNKLYLLEVLP